MIRFKCIYCGLKLLAKDDGAGKKGKCPKCGHDVRVTKKKQRTTIIPTDISKKEEKAKAKIALMDAILNSPDDTAELSEEKAGWFIPIYDEMSLFLMAITVVLLYIFNPLMQSQTYNWISSHGIHIFFWFLIFIVGLCLSIYHVFTKREKIDVEKWIMLIFAVLANAVTGIVAGIYVIKNSDVQNWLIIFPIWNIINGVLQLLMLRFSIIDESCISDRDSTAAQVIVGLAAVTILFVFCNFVFRLYWAVTFSICIIYTTSFDRALQSVFPGLVYEENEQAG